MTNKNGKKQVSNTKETIKKVFKSYIHSNWKLNLFLVIIFWIFIAFLGTLEPLFFAWIIKKLEEFYKSWIYNLSEVVEIVIYWAIFIVFTIMVTYLYQQKGISYFLNKNYADMNSIYWEKLINMNSKEYLSKQTWSIYKIFDRWCNYQFEFLFSFFMDLLKTFVSIFTIIVILFMIDPIMALLSLMLLPVMILFWVYFYKNLFPKQEKLTTIWESIFWDIWNIMSNFFLVKSLTLEKYFTKKIKNTLSDVLTKQMVLSKWWAIFDVYTSSIVMISRILVLWFWVYFVMKWGFTLSNLILFFSYIWRIYFPLWFILSKLRNIQTQLTWIEKFYSEFDNLEQENYNWKIIDEIKWEIEFKNVFFGYDIEKPIIKDLSFKIKKWEKIAIVGNTWAWKSTIINLLLKFYEADKWEILVDNENISDINKISLRKHIWIVSQDNSLFNLSVIDNLKFAKENATDEEVEKALKNANAEFVHKLTKWLETIIWERWLKLSWWEKQRISIARLFLKNPEILILDEATSALDNKTEKLVHKSLDILMKWRTSIIIAHRLTTIKNADKILMLENWKIVESWNYEELMANKSKFYELANPDKLMIN